MSKIAVVYWSGTGNTEAMAEAVAEGARGKGAEAVLIPAASFDAGQMDEFDAIAFGCPSMGVEQLEESEFEPHVHGLRKRAAGQADRPVRLIRLGRRGMDAQLGDRCADDGALLVCDSVICNEAPDDEALDAMQRAGRGAGIAAPRGSRLAPGLTGRMRFRIMEASGKSRDTPRRTGKRGAGPERKDAPLRPLYNRRESDASCFFAVYRL